jgi:hypothetical protein
VLPFVCTFNLADIFYFMESLRVGNTEMLSSVQNQPVTARVDL